MTKNVNTVSTHLKKIAETEKNWPKLKLISITSGQKFWYGSKIIWIDHLL